MNAPSHAVEATLGLGSNLGDSIQNVEEAIRRLTDDPAVVLVARSAFYRTAPWGVTDQPPFVNACIAIETTLSPRDLLARCQEIENAMGRVRTRRWGSRTIDIDILTYDALKLDEPDLVVPHPRIAERAFVLVPLHDVAPGLRFNGHSIPDLLAKLDSTDVQRIAR